MLRKVAKIVLVLATSAVVIPYTVALLAEMLYGWSSRPRGRYYRALHPRKVYALNYALLMELTKIRYIGLCNRWTWFYHKAATERLLKNITFGTNKNCLDLYMPQQVSDDSVPPRLRPVVVFIYGGTWGSGDKSLYGLLCVQLADFLDCIVICPNYSIYPKGFVDDMLQDVGDVILWLQQNVSNYGGDKDRVVLIGHSAGAHLAVLTVLELCLKRLGTNPSSLLLSKDEVDALVTTGQSSLEVSILDQSSFPLHFEESHFNGKNGAKDFVGAGDGDKPFGPETSFYVVKKEGNGEEVNEAGDSFFMIDEKTDLGGTDETEEQEVVISSEEVEKKTIEEEEVIESAENMASSIPDAIPEVIPEEKAKSTVHDLLSPIKLVIGLAGVYDIAEHYQYESWKGVESISTMARAMYGTEHFDNFSPTVIARNLPPNIRLPPIHLLHGDQDYTVPASSSLRFGETLWENGVRTVQVAILPDCSHIDICLDLMEKDRRWNGTIMREIKRGVDMYL